MELAMKVRGLDSYGVQFIDLDLLQHSAVFCCRFFTMLRTKLVTAMISWQELMNFSTVLLCSHLVNGIQLYALNHRKLFHLRLL